MDAKQHNIYITKELAGPKIRKFMDLVMNKVEGYAIKNLSGGVLKVRTGRLRSALKTKVSVNGTVVRGDIGISGGGKVGLIANVWEFTGRKKFFLEPKRKKALRFYLGGEKVFSKGHWMERQEPRPFISPAIDKATPYMYALHEKRYKDAFNFTIEINVGR